VSRVFEFTIDATCGAARAGTLVLPHGTVETPVFMPVGTQGTVRTLSPADLKTVGAQLVSGMLVEITVVAHAPRDR